MLHTERIGQVGQLGIGLAGIGTFLLATDGIHPTQAYWLGDLFLLAALVASVAEFHLIHPLVDRYGAVPMVLTRTVIGGVLYLIVAGPSLAGVAWLSLSGWTWVAILLGGTVGVGLGQWVKYRALDVLAPTRVVLYGNRVPVATIVLAWIAIGTDPSGLELAAAACIVTGAVCLQVFDPQEAKTDLQPDLQTS